MVTTKITKPAQYFFYQISKYCRISIKSAIEETRLKMKFSWQRKIINQNLEDFQFYFPLTLGKRVSEKLFLQDEFSDVKILCEDKIFPCHKVILCTQSEVFKTMLSNNTNMVEASSGEIKIADISANVIESLLYFN